MPHPALGLPPRDATAGLPDAAQRLRSNSERLGRMALENTLRDAPDLGGRYDEERLRLFLRDYERHIEQLARSLETGDDNYVVGYGESLVPIYRRRHVPMRDVIALLTGLREAAATVLSPEESEVAAGVFERWTERFRHHSRLPGDHKGNALIRFFWKGAGFGDDKWI
jgi:hypothetical protein